MSLRLLLLSLATAACPSAVTQEPSPATAESVIGIIAAISADSLGGRKTGEPGATKAAIIIANYMKRIGLKPVGDSGFLQRVPLAMVKQTYNGREYTRATLLPSMKARDSLPATQVLPGYNVIGIIEGSDPTLKNEHILVDAHYDHVGIGRPVDGDSIYNGADDDASGVAAVLEIARIISEGPKPKRTIVFATTTGEEVGLLGTKWYIDNPWRPLTEMVANLEVEMIGRPDSLVGGFGKAWLTGYERSNMGEQLAAQGIPIVADPRPDQNFFMRSDNYAFALRGIVAHTLSTFNLHRDYHTPRDEVSRMDGAHMAAVVNAAARAVRILADGPKPAWKPGGQPQPTKRD